MKRVAPIRCAGLVALTLALAPVGAAAAATSHEPLETLTSPGPPAVEPLKDACGVAVDAGGQVFVSNYYEHEIYVFEENEEPLGMHSYLTRFAVEEPPFAPTEKPIDGPCDLAFDGAGNLYVNNYHHDVVRHERLGPTSFGPGVVIDSHESTSVVADPVSGNVFAADRTPDGRSYVTEYDPSGAPVLDGSEPVTIGLGTLGKGYGVAVSGYSGTKGHVYVADAADDTIKVYDPKGDPETPIEVIDGDGTPQFGFNHLFDSDIAVDPEDGHIYVVDNLQPFFEQPEAVVDEFSPQARYRGPVPPRVAAGQSSDIVDGEPTAVAIGPDGRVYVTSGNYFDDGTGLLESDVRVFSPTANVVTKVLTVARSGAGTGIVTSSDPAGIGCGTACEGEFPLERIVTLVAIPAPHSRIAGWSGCETEPSPTKCRVTMETDRAVSVAFEPVPALALAVTKSGTGSGSVASAPVGIYCGPSCEGEFDEGSEVTLTASADPGSAFAGWTGCDSESGVGKCLVKIVGSRSVSASFAASPPPPPASPARAVQRILSVLATETGGASGTVTSEPAGIDCGATCAYPYGDGSIVTLVAHPGGHSSLLGWGGCDSEAGARCTVTLGSDKAVVAAFGPGSPGPLRLRRATVKGATAILDLVVPAPGALSATGAKLRSAGVLPVAAGRVSFKVALNEAGRRALGKADGRGLPIKVALSFSPFDGGSTVRAAKSLIFGAAGGSRR